MYQMSCYSNIQDHLAKAGITFEDVSIASDIPAGELYLAGERDAVASWQLVKMGRRDGSPSEVEVIDHNTGLIFTLIGDVVYGEFLALLIAERYSRER